MGNNNLGVDLNRKYGMDFDNYDASKLPKLPSEEEAKWFSKFYYRGRAELPADRTALFAPGNTIDPSEAITPDKLYLLMDENHPIKEGYCLLPNGAGYCYTTIRLTNITYEMVAYYMRLIDIEPLAYKIWYPGSHVSHHNNTITEDVGFGVEWFQMKGFITPEDAGLPADPSKKDPKFRALRARNMLLTPTDKSLGLEPRAMTLFHYVRELENGDLEFKTVVYKGMYIENGGGVMVQPDIDGAVALEAARQMLAHCIYERYNMIQFLPELYNGLKDTVDVSHINSNW